MSDDLIAGMDDEDALRAFLELYEVIPNPDNFFGYLLHSEIIDVSERARVGLFLRLTSFQYLDKYRGLDGSDRGRFLKLFNYIIYQSKYQEHVK